MTLYHNCVILISITCFLPQIKSCNLKYKYINSLQASADTNEGIRETNEVEKVSANRIRRDDSLFGLEAIAMSEEDENENLRLGRKVIYSNDSRITANNTRPSQITKMLNAAYYVAKTEYMFQQYLRKRYNETVPVGCHLIEGPPPATDPGASAGTPAAGTPPAGTPAAGTPPAGTPPAGTPAAGTPPAGTPPDPGTPPAPAGVRRRKRQDPANSTVDPNAEAAPPAAPAAATPAAPPANNSAPSPGAGAAPQPPTTVITTTTPKPISLVCPPSTTIATTTQAPTPAPAGAPPAAPPSGNPPATGPAQNATAPAPVDPGQNATAPVAPPGP